MEGKTSKSIRSNTTHDNSEAKKSVPNYLKPSTGSCHHVCKYGGKHTFEEKEARKAQPKPRKQPPPAAGNQKRVMIKVRSLSRRRVEDFGRTEQVDKFSTREKEAEPVEWKDIVAYDTIPSHKSSLQLGKIAAKAANSGESKKKGVIKGKKPDYKDKLEQEVVAKKQNESLNKKLAKSVKSKLTRKASSTEPQVPNKNIDATGKSIKPPRSKNSTTPPIEERAMDQEMVQEQALMTELKEEKMVCALGEECTVSESFRPVPVYRKAKSVSMGSRSFRLPFIRQSSKNVTTFKLRSKSSKATSITFEGDNPEKFRFRKGRVAGDEPINSGIHLRIRSLRRRGVDVAGGANTGFLAPAVKLKHQKTLEKKRSQRLYNNLIEETASKLVKTRKSKVKALVGAFETLISKIAK